MPDGDAPGDGLSQIRLAFERATEARLSASEPGSPGDDPDGPPDDIEPPDENDDVDGGGGEDLRPATRPLPDDCPVQPLGVQGRTFHFLDAHRQHQEVPWKDLQRSVIIGLFGDGAREYLWTYWPRKRQDQATGAWKTYGWAPEECQFDLAEACARRGVWSPRARLRGAGAWKAPDGALILHCGDRIYRYPMAGAVEASAPGLIGDHVYPAAPAIPRPWADPVPGEKGPAWSLLALLKTWSWARPTIDPILMLGWLGAAMIGGALKFRPMVWVTGEHGSGKSTLQDLVKWLMGTTGLLSVANATAAGIYQTLGYSALPAALDEQEASADNRKVTGVLELAREAATGAMRARGGADHEAKAFNIQSAFLFSSILMPSMEPQDVSRFAVLALQTLPQGAKPPAISEAAMGEMGRQMLRRLVDGWSRWTVTLGRYHDALTSTGKHSGRGADLFATLLACADLMLADRPPEQAALDRWAQRLDATRIAELDGAMSDKISCLHYLLTSRITDQHNKRERSIAEWVAMAAGANNTAEEQRINANQILSLSGLKWLAKDGFSYLAVANSHQGVAAIFRDTKWAATAGNVGVWRQSLGNLSGSVIGHQVKMPPNCRSVLIPLSHFLPEFPAPPGDGTESSAAGRPPGTAIDPYSEVGEAGDRCAADTDHSTASAQAIHDDDGGGFDLV